MSDISIRKLKDSAMREAYRLVADSGNVLMKRSNRKPVRIRITAPNPFMMHLKHTDPDGCIGAFESDRMVGFACSIIRENQWYLPFLFIAPGRWGRGIGRKLLRRSLSTADRREVDLFSLCTFSHNPHAVALYISFGMPPQSVILHMLLKTANRTGVRLSRQTRKLTMRRIEDYETLGFVNRLDRKNRGVARPEDHKYFIDDKETELIGFHDGRRPVGYSVVGADGRIGPVSAIDPEFLLDILNICVRRSVDAGRALIRVNCPGNNTAISKHLLGLGFRIMDPLLLMSNKPFGNLDCYLPGPLTIF